MNAWAHRLGLGLAVVLVAGVLPSAASATDYCVDVPSGCTGTKAGSLEEALGQADDKTDPDRIFLGAGLHTASSATGFYYSESSSPVEIFGAGRGETVLTAPSAASFVLRLIGGPGSSVQDLTIQLPPSAAAGIKGLSTSNMARRIEVREAESQANDRSGVELVNGGTLEDSTVKLGTGQQTAGVRFESGGGILRRSTTSAHFGVWSEYGGTIEQSRLTGSYGGLVAYRNLTTVSSSLIRFTGPGLSAGIAGATRFASTTSIKADGVTIVGPGGANTFGVMAITGILTGAPVDVSLTNSLIRGAATPLAAIADTAGQARVTASYSDYDPSGNVRQGRADDTTITETNVSNVGDAGFAGPDYGDYRLRPDSPLLDMGNPGTAQGLDLDGNPLVADGNGDGTARRDLGAFELQPAPGGGTGPAPDTRAPLVSGFRASPSVFAVARAGTPLVARVARGTRFRYALGESALVTMKIQRALPGRRAGGRCLRPRPRLRTARRCTRYRTVGALSRVARSGANSTRFSGRLGRRALRPGSYRALITATDTAGNRSAPQATRFRVVRG
jgi:hypothetical protein